jgi:thiosulfate sulfurtransferase
MSEQETFKHLHIDDLHKTLSDKTYVVVDIRDENSFQANHIPGALHLSNESLGDFIRDADMDSPVVVCCYHGISSQQAAQFLISQDFTEVYSLDGGFTDWQLHYPEDVEH